MGAAGLQGLAGKRARRRPAPPARGASGCLPSAFPRLGRNGLSSQSFVLPADFPAPGSKPGVPHSGRRRNAALCQNRTHALQQAPALQQRGSKLQCLFDHLSGTAKQRKRDGESEPRPGCPITGRCSISGQVHSALIAAACMIGHHLSISAFWKAWSASGVCWSRGGIS